jgi:hypothetical protein
MASLNYHNKAPGSTFTNQDIAKGYSSALIAALGASVSLRYLTQNMTKRASGPRLLMMNTVISCTASGIAAYFNTTCIRQAEINNGI